MLYRNIFVVLLVVASVSSCSNDSHKEADKEENGHGENVIEFSEKQQATVGLRTEVIKRERFGQVIKSTARIMPSKGDEQIVSAAISGVVNLASADVTEGVSVANGERLASVVSEGLADNDLKVKYQAVAAEYNRAKDIYERKKALVAERIVSQSDFAEATALYKSAEAEYNSYRKNFSSGSQSVVSPMSGFVKQIFVSNGEYVEAGTPLFVVTQSGKLTVSADVQPKYFSVLPSIVSANFRQLGTQEVFSLEELDGKLLSYSKAVSDENPMLTVVFQINNTGTLLPGGFLETYIKTQSSASVLTVSRDAVVEEMGAYFVFVQTGKDDFEKRVVSLGETDGKRAVVESGIKEGERIVVNGAVMLKLSQSTGTIDPHTGHSH